MSANWRGCERILEWQTGSISKAVMLRHRVALCAYPLAEHDSSIWAVVFGKWYLGSLQ